MAAACVVVAVFFVFRDDYEKAFVAATAGAVCWFLSYRQQLREALPKENEEDKEPDEEVRS